MFCPAAIQDKAVLSIHFRNVTDTCAAFGVNLNITHSD